MASLNLASFVIGVLGLVFLFNPQVAWGMNWVHRSLRSLLTPKDLKVESLLWRDASGPLHSHSGQGNICTYCTQSKTHAGSKRCWHTTIALVFNNCWDASGDRTTVPKPSHLPLSESFLRTDARFVLAYFLCTARINSFQSEMLGSSLHYIDIQEQHGLIIAHLGRAERVLELTREEVERILAGWPPFYRQSFLSHEGHLLESPLTVFDHLRRPGWIVAIGLGRVQPTDVFVDNSTDKETSLFGYAILRVQRMLEVVLEDEWPGHSELAKGREVLRTMMRYGPTPTRLLENSELAESQIIPYPKRETIHDLIKAQCQSLMRVFHVMSVSTDDRNTIEPVMGICIHRVLLGVAVAKTYASNNRVIKIPPVLQGDKIVYLRDCQSRDSE